MYVPLRFTFGTKERQRQADTCAAKNGKKEEENKQTKLPPNKEERYGKTGACVPSRTRFWYKEMTSKTQTMPRRPRGKKKKRGETDLVRHGLLGQLQVALQPLHRHVQVPRDLRGKLSRQQNHFQRGVEHNIMQQV